VKTRDLVKKLKSAGYTKERSGDHITYEKEGGRPVQVPHGREVNEYTAQAILKDAGIK
jgi:predicted RNA binding protein YcfA (HicA-like mRNA interferase family)